MLRKFVNVPNSSTNLLNYNRVQLRQYFADLGAKPFHGDQVLQWIHTYGMTDFALMTNLPQMLRQDLTKRAIVQVPQIVRAQHSQDGTIKYLIQLTGGSCIETVYIPEGNRGTLCVSSQVGCALKCSFCATGQLGLKRNLSVAEIIGQVWLVARALAKTKGPQIQGKHARAITNIVMMGMGEPLHNFTNVVTAMQIMLDDLAYGLSKYRVTLSTSGLVPKMRELAEQIDVALAVSLHAPNDSLRNQLVPINKKYPLDALMAVCRDYFGQDSKRQIVMEYVMLAGVNDSSQHAKQLRKILAGIPAKVNLIPFNPFPGTHYKTSSITAIDAFREILIKADINTITRKTRGDDIAAACGQLVGEVE